MDFHPVESAFQDAVAQGVFPGAVVLVSKDGEIVFEQAFGSRSLIPEKTPLKPNTIFDLASLTKPLATTVAIMILVREKKIRLDDQITRFIPMFGVFGKSTATFRQMLNHSSGLPAWKPFHEEIVKMEKAGRINFVASRAARAASMNRSTAKNRWCPGA
jgi:CubicO group peptidase (beta-lactamase class C family)